MVYSARLTLLCVTCWLLQIDKMRWDKDPMKNACEAYLNARKELTILLSLHHNNIVPLLGVSLQPLCLILKLAPLGSLSDQLSEYRRAGARLPVTAITTIIKQVTHLHYRVTYNNTYWVDIFNTPTYWFSTFSSTGGSGS